MAPVDDMPGEMWLEVARHLPQSSFAEHGTYLQGYSQMSESRYIPLCILLADKA
jgi:hypothetical protein